MSKTVSQEELDNAQCFWEFVPVYKIDSKTIVKSSQITRLAGAETMRLVRNNTGVPVPEVYNVYKEKESGHTWVIMEFVERGELEEAWDTYSAAEKESATAQLRGHMEELRQFKGTFIGAIDESPCDDHVFDGNCGGYGLFKDEEDFVSGPVSAQKQARKSKVLMLILPMKCS